MTNHGFKNGEATELHSVLQAGTGVLVDAHGVPRVRCYCGNPLLPPTAGSARYTGANWPGFSPDAVTTITASTRPVAEFLVVAPGTGDVLRRPSGSDGDRDHPGDDEDKRRVHDREAGGGDQGTKQDDDGVDDKGGTPSAGGDGGNGNGGTAAPGTPPTVDPTGAPVTAEPGTGGSAAVEPPVDPGPPDGTEQGATVPGTGGTVPQSGTSPGIGGAPTGGGTTNGGTTNAGVSSGGGTSGASGGGGTAGGGEPSTATAHDAVVPRSAATAGP